MTLNRYRLRHLANDGHRGAKLAQALLKKTDHLLGAILLGNTFAAVAIATISDDISMQMLGEGNTGLIDGTDPDSFASALAGKGGTLVVA